MACGLREVYLGHCLFFFNSDEWCELKEAISVCLKYPATIIKKDVNYFSV